MVLSYVVGIQYRNQNFIFPEYLNQASVQNAIGVNLNYTLFSNSEVRHTQCVFLSVVDIQERTSSNTLIRSITHFSLLETEFTRILLQISDTSLTRASE